MSRKDSETGKNVKKLTSHKTSKYHRDYVKLLNDEETANDSAGELSNIRKKSKHQIIFLQVLQNSQFLTRHVLAFRNLRETVRKRCEKLDPRITECSNE